MRTRHAKYPVSLAAALCALIAAGCESPQPVAWGPTRTSSGWSSAAGDSVGAAMSQPHSIAVAAARRAESRDQVATVRTEP